MRSTWACIKPSPAPKSGKSFSRVLARFLRPDRHRRMSPGQRGGGLGLARNSRTLLFRHADRIDRHAQGNWNVSRSFLRQAGLLLLAQAGHPGWLPCAVQGHQDPYRPRRGGLPAEKGTLDREGDEVEDRIYNQKDFDRVLVLDERTKLVARKVTSSSRKVATVPENDRLLRR